MATRREACRTIGIALAALSVNGFSADPAGADSPGSAAPYSLPKLPYANDALEPNIDAETMTIHHDKHHAAYVKNLNTAIVAYPDLAKLPVDELITKLDVVPEASRVVIRNNAGGHANHCFFWQLMAKNGGGEPKAEVARAIDQKFGGFGAFQDQFTKAALGVFGSGWTWLSLDKNRELNIETTSNQENPRMYGRVPVLGIDVWEHAYYLKYQNRRADYLSAFYKVIAWDFVAEQFRLPGKEQ
jgi:superoxide dismutase, Fe-Mn family